MKQKVHQTLVHPFSFCRTCSKNLLQAEESQGSWSQWELLATYQWSHIWRHSKPGNLTLWRLCSVSAPSTRQHLPEKAIYPELGSQLYPWPSRHSSITVQPSEKAGAATQQAIRGQVTDILGLQKAELPGPQWEQLDQDLWLCILQHITDWAVPCQQSYLKAQPQHVWLGKQNSAKNGAHFSEWCSLKTTKLHPYLSDWKEGLHTSYINRFLPSLCPLA